MTRQSQSAFSRFISSARDLFAKEQKPEKRWAQLEPLLRELLADPSISMSSKNWPNCSQKDRAETSFSTKILNSASSSTDSLKHLRLVPKFTITPITGPSTAF